MGFIRLIFSFRIWPFGIWIAGVAIWVGVMITALTGEIASAKPRPAGQVPSPGKSDKELMEAEELGKAFEDFVTVYKREAKCPTTGCMTLDVHFTALTAEAQARSAGQWITELNTWFYPNTGPRQFVFRFGGLTPFKAVRESGCSGLLSSADSPRTAFVKAVKECGDKRIVDPEAITVFITGAPKVPSGATGSFGELNEFRPFLRVNAAELAEVAPGGQGWKLHFTMREALGLPVSGGGRSPAFSVSETEILLGNVEKVFNRLSPDESVDSMSFEQEE